MRRPPEFAADRSRGAGPTSGRKTLGTPWILAVAAAAGLTLGAPTAGTARVQSVRDPGAGTTPASEILGGGVVRLRAPVAEMIRVPRSTFAMGSDEIEIIEAAAACRRSSPSLPRSRTRTDEDPCSEAVFAVELARHRVTLSAYWLDRVEVSVGAYRRCAELGRCSPLPLRSGGRRLDRPELPASLVRWEDAQAYCRFRGARLPTEAEFERAARGAEGRRFPWGETFHRRAANHGRFGWDRSVIVDGYAELAPVGSFPAGRTPEGFLDLAGNVAEWVSDLFSTPYPGGPVTDPQGPPHGFAPGATTFRVLRGGSYELPASFLRGAARLPQDGAARDPSIGFRCARSATAVGASYP